MKISNYLLSGWDFLKNDPIKNFSVFGIGITVSAITYKTASYFSQSIVVPIAFTVAAFVIKKLFFSASKPDQGSRNNAQFNVNLLPSQQRSKSPLSKVENIISKQKETLDFLTNLNQTGKSKEIQNQHFDWWMFPTDRASLAQNILYQLSVNEIKELSINSRFMENYKKGFSEVAKSWGWDLTKNTNNKVGPLNDQWNDQWVRFGKMLHSLLFLKHTIVLKNSIKSGNN